MEKLDCAIGYLKQLFIERGLRAELSQKTYVIVEIF